MNRLTSPPGLVVGLVWLIALTPAAPAQSPSQYTHPIPMSELGAKAGAQYQGDGLSLAPTPEGARLRCVFQKLEGQITGEGLWLTSTAEPQTGEKFRVVARAIGRNGTLTALPPQGAVSVSDKRARCVRPGLTEEYSVSVDGVRQDFVVTQRPAGSGALRVQLKVDGAKVEPLVDGARLVLDGSGRRIAYNRLHVVDAAGRKLEARMEVSRGTRLVVLVEDAAASYPVRIDPTFSDENWISMGGLPGAVAANGARSGGRIIFAVVVDAAGNLYVGGAFQVVGDVAVNNVAKWDGSSWSALGEGMGGVQQPCVAALVVSGNDLYAGGLFTTAGGVSANCIAKWNGSVWSALGEGMSNGWPYTAVNALALSDGNLYAGGIFNTAGGVNWVGHIAKWDGSGWSALGSGIARSQGTPWVAAVAVSGTHVYVGGVFDLAGGGEASSIAQWNGTTWSALGSGIRGSVSALAVSGGDLYVGGGFDRAGGLGAYNIAKWNGSTWSALGSVGLTGVQALAVSGGDLYAGGGWGVRKWNGSAWSALGSGITGSTYGNIYPVVSALAVSGSDLYAGGAFTAAGGVGANSIARWNSSAWSALSSGIESGLNNVVVALAVSGGDLFAAGLFSAAGGVSADRIAKWNGSAWSALSSGVNGSISALAVSGSDVYAAGSFTMAGGVSAKNIAKWDGSAWSALGSELNGGVTALAVTGTNLFVGGAFTDAGGVSANYIVKWNGSAWSALGSGMNSVPQALVVAGGDLFAGGWFSTAGGASANRIAQWDGSAWSALGSGMNDSISALAASGSDLYAGGDFTSAGGVSANFLAKWDGTAWSALGSGMNGKVRALAVSGANLYVGGYFTTAGGKVSAHVARAPLTGTDTGQAFSLLDYYYPIHAGNQWVYDSRDNGSPWTTTCRILSAAFPLNCYSNCSPVVPYTRNTVPVLFDQGGGTTWTNFMHVADTGFGYVGSDHVEGSRLRFGPGFIFTNRFALGQTVSVADEIYSGGICSGQGTLSIRLMGLADVTVPYGSFADCLHLEITSTIAGSITVDEHWWAKGVGPVKWTHVGEGDFETNELSAASFVSPPRIAVPPQSQTVTVGSAVNLSVEALGDAPLSYQWRKDGAILANGGSISGVTTANLTMSDIQTNDAGDYSVVVTNAYGSVTSSVASLTVDDGSSWAIRVASTVNPDDELAMGLATDGAGNLYVSGWFDGVNDFGGTTLTSFGGQDAFVAKYSPAGVLQWVRQAGGASAGWDCARGVGVDAAGNVYVTGGFLGTATFGGTSLTSLNNQDAFLAKYDAGGTLQWVRQAGDSSHSAYGTGITVDSNGNTLLAGYFEGQTVSFGSVTATNAGYAGGSYAVFIVKCDSAGTVQWARGLGGGDTYSTTVGMDDAGNCYVAGSFQGTLQLGTTSLTSAGDKDGFLAKFNSDGVLQWTRQVAGTGRDSARLGVDAAGSPWLVGDFTGSASIGEVNLTSPSGYGFFVARYDASGNLQWIRRAESDGFFRSEGGCAADAAGNCYIPGMYSDTLDFGGTFITNRGGWDIFTTKYDSTGSFQWVQTGGGTGNDGAFRAAVDPVGNCYIAGWFQDTAQIGSNTLTAQGYWDMFVAKVASPVQASLRFGEGSLSVLNGSLQMRLAGTPGATVVVDTSLDLMTWTPWQTNTMSAGGLPLTIPMGTDRQFLRARTP